MMVLYYKISKKYRVPSVILITILSGALNGFIGYTNQLWEFPFFFDSTFTILVAGLIGLWPGLLVGVLSNFFFELFAGFPGYIFPFTIVNIITASATYFLVRKQFIKTAPGLLWMIIIIALLNALFGAIIVSYVFGGITNQPVDSVVKAIVVTGQSLFTSAFLGRILVNVVDKGVGILILFLIHRRLSRENGQKLYNSQYK